MKKIYLMIALLVGLKASSQLNYQVANAQNVPGTFTSISATGTTISTADKDNSNSSPVDIGFTFNYNGQAYTQFIFNTNGFIKLGATAPASASIFGTAGNDGSGGVLHGAGNSNSISVFNHDLIGTATAEYKVQTTGVVGNRVTTIEWKNVTEKTTTPAIQYTSMDFQIKLYEGSNVIELIYANYVPSAGTDAFKVANVGIVGTDNTGTNVIYVNKGSTAAWSAASFSNTPTSATQSFNFRKNFPPDNGRTFRFTPTFANDVAVTRIETLGKLPIGISGPETIKAFIRNIGANPVTTFSITLTVTGANTYTNTKVINATVPAGAGGTVSFDPVTFTNPGVNNLTATITTTDDNQSNNTTTFTQEVNPSVFSYANSFYPVTGSVGYNTGAGLILTKYGVTGTGYVNAVNVFLANTAASLGNSVYGVVLNKAGAIIGQSAPITITAADTGKLVRFNITAPPTVTNDTIFVGLAQTANAITGYFPVGYQNEGVPTRSGAFYTAPLAGGAPAENTAIGRFWTEAVVDNFLPLDLLNFSGKLNNNKVDLKWTTINEVNTSHFDVERSENGSTFGKVGAVNSVSTNPNAENVYQFADMSVSTLRSSVLYYRLKQVDKDGKFKYSSVVRVKKGDNTFEITVVNPAKDRVTLQVNSEVSERVNINLFNLAGQMVASQNTAISAGSNSISIGQNLSKGSYIVTVNRDGELSSHKVIVE